MMELLNYFAWYYVIGMILMALFIRFYLRKKRLKNMKPPGQQQEENE